MTPPVRVSVSCHFTRNRFLLWNCYHSIDIQYNKFMCIFADMEVYPQELCHDKYGIGLWYLTRHLEKIFKAAVLTYKAHPLCVHSILDYYFKVEIHSCHGYLLILVLSFTVFLLFMCPYQDLFPYPVQWLTWLLTSPLSLIRTKRTSWFSVLFVFLARNWIFEENIH